VAIVPFCNGVVHLYHLDSLGGSSPQASPRLLTTLPSPFPINDPENQVVTYGATLSVDYSSAESQGGNSSPSKIVNQFHLAVCLAYSPDGYCPQVSLSFQVFKIKLVYDDTQQRVFCTVQRLSSFMEDPRCAINDISLHGRYLAYAIDVKDLGLAVLVDWKKADGKNGSDDPTFERMYVPAADSVRVSVLFCWVTTFH